MKNFTLGFLLVLLSSAAFGQLQVDHSIDLTGTAPGNARVMGIKQVIAPQDAVSAEALQTGSLIYATVSGGPNTYTLTFSPAISTPYNEGMIVTFKANGDNTGGVTLNGISVKKDVSTSLGAGDIKDDQLVTVAYDGANFQLSSRTADNNSGGTVTSVSTAAANNGVTAAWANATTTPALTIGLGAITPSSVAASGTVTGSNLSGTHSGTSSGTNTGDQDLSGLAPTSRTITINGSAQNLTADRTWSVGTVTSVSTAAQNNGVTATWTNSTTTPALTIGLGAITPTSISTSGNISASGTITASNFSGSHSGTSSGTNTGDQNLSGLVSGTGTQNFVTKWNNAAGTSIGNSLIYDNGASVGIGAGSSPAASAALDITSTTKGFLPPRMTTAQRDAISSPATGLTIYNTNTNCLNYYNGASWVIACADGAIITATGGTITNITGYRVHTFNSSGTFTVTSGSGNVEVLVVGGGGGAGGGNYESAGGGGGGVLYYPSYPVANGQAITVTVGAGGAGRLNSNGVDGNNSSFGSLVAIGGGAGANNSNTNGSGQTGGSGGGGTSGGNGTFLIGTGTGGQGNNGGIGFNGAPNYGQGGGGGAGAVGGNGTSTAGGKGGDGAQFAISGTLTYYGGGGGGSTYLNPTCGTVGAGGLGGGGAGTCTGAGGNGTANTGGGGGAAERNGVSPKGGDGGSGVVIVRYPH